jgi:phosphoglycolate phosphatase-like HAD superfamily hydrolase
VVFPAARVHGYTDESIVIESAVASGVSHEAAEHGIARFHDERANVMSEGEEELARDQPAYPDAAESTAELDKHGFVQTVSTGNMRYAAETELRVAGLDSHLRLDLGAYGSDSRDRLELHAVVADRYLDQFGSPLPISQTVVVGDAPNDIYCARHAGLQVVVVTLGRSATNCSNTQTAIECRAASSRHPISTAAGGDERTALRAGDAGPATSLRDQPADRSKASYASASRISPRTIPGLG